MQVIEYFSASRKEHWLSKIGESDWSAGRFLHKLLQDGRLKELVGQSARVLLLTDGDDLVSFCTFAEKDDIQPTELTPWIGWAYTFPQHRGHRHMGKLFSRAEELAKAEGAESIHISTNHVGLYEKYGYEFLAVMKDVEGEDSRVYVKRLVKG